MPKIDEATAIYIGDQAATAVYVGGTKVWPPTPSGSQAFAYTGAMVEFEVPDGVTAIYADARGADGGPGNQGLTVGRGARVRSLLAVTPGETLRIRVGGRGESGSGAGSGGYNGGGDASISGAGGGATDIRRGGDTLADRVLVAGGAGGTGSRSGTANGGHGGDPDGGDPVDSSPAYTASSPTGATTTAGGVGGVGVLPSGMDSSVVHGDAGTLGQGGSNPSAGAGGGGGLYGGGQASIAIAEEENYFPFGPSAGGGSSFSAGTGTSMDVEAPWTPPAPGYGDHGSLTLYWGDEIPA